MTPLLVFLMLAAGPDAPPDLPPDVVSGNTRFALDLYGRLCRDPGNLFFSPHSISTALAMTYAGARGETADQMARALHFPEPPGRLHRGFAALRDRLAAGEGKSADVLNVANRLWGAEGYSFQGDYLAITRESFGAELATLDFARAEAARQAINAWVSDQTRGKIPDLIPTGVLDAQTRLVLTNAVYFKGAWADPFLPEATREQPFRLSGSETVPARFMHHHDDYRHHAADGLQALELPYAGGELSMVVLLPDDVDGLPALERKLTAENLSRWLGAMRFQDVQLSLPRFKMTSRFSMADALAALGMPAAFDPATADFSGIATQEGLFLSAVVHQAFVEVNEEGTEAAAATGIAVGATAMAVPRKPIVFHADHPFLFLIRHRPTGAILFLGRVANPAG